MAGWVSVKVLNRTPNSWVVNEGACNSSQLSSCFQERSPDDERSECPCWRASCTPKSKPPETPNAGCREKRPREPVENRRRHVEPSALPRPTQGRAGGAFHTREETVQNILIRASGVVDAVSNAARSLGILDTRVLGRFQVG